MNEKKTPLDEQYPAIDKLFHEVAQSSRYAQLADVSEVASIEDYKSNLFKNLESNVKNGAEYTEIEKRVDFDLEDLTMYAAFTGEEKGFITGYLHAAQLFCEIIKGQSLQLGVMERM